MQFNQKLVPDILFLLNTMELKNILTGVADRLSGLREERPSAGTRYRLMGMMADIAEVTDILSEEVLERVKQASPQLSND